VRTACYSAGYYGTVDFNSRFLIREVLKFHYVIDSRKAALDDIKLAFRSTPIMKFLTARPYLWEAAFPKISSMKYTAVEVMSHVDFEGVGAHLFQPYLMDLLLELEGMICKAPLKFTFCAKYSAFLT